jgi:hypothetical protein
MTARNPLDCFLQRGLQTHYTAPYQIYSIIFNTDNQYSPLNLLQICYLTLRYVLNVRTDSTSLLHIHRRHMAKMKKEHEYCIGARKQRRLIISRTALLNMELKIQGSVDCPLTSLCQLLMLLRHTDHSKQIMETFMLRMSTLSRENESIAQLCKASVTTASHS